MRMKHGNITSGKRLSVNLSIDADVIAIARDAGVNLSRVSEAALRSAAREALDARWKQQNRAWIEAHRAWVETNELPLERYRLF